MDKKRHAFEKLPIYILLVYSLANIWGPLLAVNLNSFSRLMATILVGIIAYLLLSYPFVMMISMLLSAIPVAILSRYNSELAYKVFGWIQQFIENLSNYFNGSQQILIQNRTAFWVVLTFGLCLTTWIILLKMKQVWLLIPLYVPAFIYYWYIYVDASYQMIILFFVMYFILLGRQGYFSAQKEWLQRNINHKGDVYSEWLKTAIAYGLIIVLLAAVLPKGSNMVDWYWLEARLVERFPIILEFRDDLVYSRSYGHGDLFDFSQTGYQTDSTRLGGPVRPSERVVMKVKSKQPLYLRGSVKTIYGNNRWDKAKTNESVYGTNQILPREVMEGTILEIEITNINMASATLFTPYQPIRVVSDTNVGLKLDKNFQVTQFAEVYKNESYKVQAILPLEQSKQEIINGTEYTTDRQYLQLPQNLSPEIYKFANEITQGEETVYGKAEAIRNYLRSNYVYSLEPSNPPQGKDFVEHFLFEEKEGYCTYFATSMAVLLRAVGIQSRYIEGYRMPENHVDNVYEIMQKHGHAWVEAYVYPMGWLVFEATPAYQPLVTQGTRVSNNNTDGDIESNFDELAVLSSSGREKGDNSHNVGNNREENQTPINTPQEDLVYKFTQKVLDNIMKEAPKLLYLILAGFFIFRIAYNSIKIMIYKKKLIKSNSRLSIMLIYQNLLDLFKEMGNPINNGETPYEYSQRIINKIYDKSYDINQLTELFVRVKYGGKEVEEKDIQHFFNYLNHIDKKLRRHMGFWAYHYKKYIRGTIVRRYNI